MERIFRFPIKVGKESIDVLGHTNNKEYLRWMEEAAKTYPQYEFERHKGYGTKRHYELLRRYGPCPIHRRTFLKKL